MDFKEMLQLIWTYGHLYSVLPMPVPKLVKVSFGGFLMTTNKVGNQILGFTKK
jgi:hypothetical protein